MNNIYLGGGGGDRILLVNGQKDGHTEVHIEVIITSALIQYPIKKKKIHIY